MSKQFNVCAIFGERRSMKSAIMYAGRLCRTSSHRRAAHLSARR